jgi:hypothetical protein
MMKHEGLVNKRGNLKEKKSKCHTNHSSLIPGVEGEKYEIPAPTDDVFEKTGYLAQGEL